jgi:hypothetical protein|tara:strand:+ start:565 stop:1170 length:606 start_codon:yes stop_codon:yes gene_type:complete
MSKILIVGNGPSALENKYGELIDSGDWDIVMRFNRWNKNDDGTEHNDYSEYIGTRCDYWMINDLRLQVGINRRNEYSGVFVVCPKFKYNQQVFNQIENQYENIKFMPMEYEEYINENIVDFSPKWPSTGVIGMYFATLHFDEVFLYGFDTYDNKYDNIHYFEDKPNKYKGESNKDHEPSKEKEFIKLIKERYSVKLLEETL